MFILLYTMESYRLNPENIEELRAQWIERIETLKQELKKRQTANKDDLENELADLEEKLAHAEETLASRFNSTLVDPNYSIESYTGESRLSYLLGILQLKPNGEYKPLLPIVQGINPRKIDEQEGNTKEMTLSIKNKLEKGIMAFVRNQKRGREGNVVVNNEVSISDVPIYLLVANASRNFPHATLLILYQDEVYSFGYGYLGMKQVEAGFNAATSNVCHLGRGSVYTPDSVLDPSRNPLQRGQRDDLMTKIQSGDKTLKDVRVMVKMIYDEEKNLSVDIPGTITGVREDDENQYTVLLDGNSEITPHNKEDIYIDKERGYLIKDIGIVTPQILDNIKRNILGDRRNKKAFDVGTVNERDGNYFISNDTNYNQVCGDDAVSRFLQQKTSNCVKFAQDVIGQDRLSCNMQVSGISTPVLHPANCKRRRDPLTDANIERFVQIMTSSEKINMNELLRLLDYGQGGGGKKTRKYKKRKGKGTKKGKKRASKMTRKKR